MRRVHRAGSNRVLEGGNLAVTDFLAHSKNSAGHKQSLADHLQGVADLASEFASAFGAEEEARLAGLLHDLGKYGDLFQLRLQGKERGIDHWSAGAWTALSTYKLNGICAALAIQGHHIGLQQSSKDALAALEPTRLRQALPPNVRLSEPDLGTLTQRLADDDLRCPDEATESLYAGLGAPSAAAMLDVRMLYSALVDADFLDTEAHVAGDASGHKRYRQPGPVLNAERDLSVLFAYLQGLAEDSKAAPHIIRLRSDLLTACLEAANLPQGLFTLTAPTGAGKTLSMLAFALKHAVEHGLRRIVMVIPYLNIIDQTVQEYRRVLAAIMGPEALDRYVLEHHSLAGTRGGGPESNTKDEQENVRRLLAQNWDAPIIVTTSVQFLESLFANRSSACRKLHRLANSVVLFDEVQTLPTRLAVPTLATLSRLAERYDASVVFSTATQPAFSHLDEPVRKYCAQGWQPREIVPADLRLFERAKRTKIAWPQADDASVSWGDVTEQLAAQQQVLCIVNMKRHAWTLLSELRKREVPGLLHLSTNMCPAHRKTALEEVRVRLETKMPCCLISTQCVEAGVDVDFPTVFRAWGPLDAIAQAAGRCNRNGNARTGTVHVFRPEDDGKQLYPDGAYGQAAGVAGTLLARRGEDQMDIQDTHLFEEYYRELYAIRGVAEGRGDLLAMVDTQHFAEVAKLYRIIKQDSINVLVPYDREAFEALAEEVRQTGLTRDWVRKARAHTVGVFRPRGDSPLMDWLEPIAVHGGRKMEPADDWFIYSKEGGYDDLTGLVLDGQSNYEIA